MMNLPPAVWLCLWIIGTAACCFLCTWAGYWIGYDHAGRDMHRTARHRIGDPPPAPPGLPHAGRLEPLPEHAGTIVTTWTTGSSASSDAGGGGGTMAAKFEDWTFGGAALEQQSGPDEYQLMIAQAAEPCETCLDESDSAFTRRQAREVDELIARIKAETDHLIDARFAPGETETSAA
jgi:hypothetical protein